jgi:hypothetical protein
MTNLIVKDRKQRRRMLLLTNLTPDDAPGPDCNPLVFATMLFQAYLARWGIETCFDLLKNEIVAPIACSLHQESPPKPVKTIAVPCSMPVCPPFAKNRG